MVGMIVVGAVSGAIGVIGLNQVAAKAKIRRSGKPKVKCEKYSCPLTKPFGKDAGKGQ